MSKTDKTVFDMRFVIQVDKKNGRLDRTTSPKALKMCKENINLRLKNNFRYFWSQYRRILYLYILAIFLLNHTIWHNV